MGQSYLVDHVSRSLCIEHTWDNGPRKGPLVFAKFICFSVDFLNLKLLSTRLMGWNLFLQIDPRGCQDLEIVGNEEERLGEDGRVPGRRLVRNRTHSTEEYSRTPGYVQAGKLN